MNISKPIILSFVMLLNSFFSLPQGYQVGSLIKDFKLLDVSGRSVSLSNYNTAKGFIIVFTCNTCPFSKLYDERLNQLNLKYEPLGFPVLAINANDPVKQPDDSYELMKQKSQEKQFTFPYLFDEEQKVTTLFNPLKTPQAFVLIKENNNYKVAYSGSIDDNSSNAAEVKVRFVENAVDELIHGRKVTITNSKPVGCTVKWKKMSY